MANISFRPTPEQWLYTFHCAVQSISYIQYILHDPVISLRLMKSLSYFRSEDNSFTRIVEISFYE